jgi:hypothetical protein
MRKSSEFQVKTSAKTNSNIGEPGTVRPVIAELVPLGTFLETVDDFYILESLKIISLKSVWNVNSATEAMRTACLSEWHNRHGSNEPYDVELSQDTKEQLEFESSNSF